MGGDGGSYAQRSEQVKLKKRPNKWEENPDDIRKDLYSRCALTKNLLEEPVVICGMGNLYNKQTVIEHCIEPTSKDYAYQHLRSLKHVIDVKAQTETEKDSGRLMFTCPITGRMLKGVFKFVVMRGCGCMISLEAVEKLGEEQQNSCVNCGQACAPAVESAYELYIPVFPTDMVVKDLLLDRILKERKAEKVAKAVAKAEKKKKAKLSSSAEGKVEKVETAPVEEKLNSKDEKKRLKKLKRKEEKAKAREEEQQRKKAKKSGEPAEDPRAKYDPRFKSKVFQSIFYPAGDDMKRKDTQYYAGISTKALHNGFIT